MLIRIVFKNKCYTYFTNNYFRIKWKRRTKQVVFVLIVWYSLSMTRQLSSALISTYRKRGGDSLCTRAK
jgi:hypothetical protein